MAINNKDCGCSPYTACSPVTCTSYVAPECEAFNLGTSNTLDRTGLTDVTDVTLDVKKISAFREHLEFVNSPVGLSNIVGHTVLRLSNKFLTGVANLFKSRSLGRGAQIYKGATTVGTDTFQDFRTIRSTESISVSQSTEEIFPTVNQSWLNQQLPNVDYPVTSGENVKTDASAVGVYKTLANKKLQFKSLISSDIIISEVGDDIKFSLPGGGTTSAYFYLDSNFIRPITWGDPVLNPKIEVLNTDIYPTAKKIPTGKLNDPFIDYTEFLLFAVGNKADSNSYGTFTTANPKITGGTLQILSNISTSQRIEVNTWGVYLNNATINFTGTASETYALDMRRLWSAENFDVGTGKIKRPITFLLGGEGSFTRVNGLGIIYSKGDETKTTPTNYYSFVFDPIGSGLNILEPHNPFPDTNPNVRLTRADGITLLNNGNSPVFGRVQAPTTPLIVIDGSTFGYWGATVKGTKIFIIAVTQPHIKFINGGDLSSSGGQIMYQVGNSVIGYETKMIQDAPGNTADENAFLSTRIDSFNFPGEKGFFYKPFEGYNVFDIQSGYFRVENLSTEPNGFLHAGANAVVNIGDNAIFDNVVSWGDTGGGGALKLIKSTGVPRYIKISNLDLISKTDVLVEGDGVNPANIVASNSKFNGVRKITENVPVFNFYTEGTLCSIKGNSIISMNDFLNNSDAKTIGKLITGMLYRNTTTGVITQVI